jgi:hypothetical protein
MKRTLEFREQSTDFLHVGTVLIAELFQHQLLLLIEVAFLELLSSVYSLKRSADDNWNDEGENV